MVKDSKIDKVLITATALLILFGLILIHSATSIQAGEKFGSSFYFLEKQLIWLLLGLIAAFVISLLKRPYYLYKPVVITVVALVAVGLLLVFFNGKLNNSYRLRRSIRNSHLLILPS